MKLIITLLFSSACCLPAAFSATEVPSATGTVETAPVPTGYATPGWLTGYLPAAVLVLEPRQAGPIKDLFDAALTRIQAAKPVRLDPLPVGQQPPKLQQREILDLQPQKSADAGFWVLLSQSGKVVALYAAFSTDEQWTRKVATAIAAATYTPARYNGRAVPILIPVRIGIDRQISIN